MVSSKNIKSFIKRSCRFGMFLPLSNLVINKGRGRLSNDFLNKLSERRNKKIQFELTKSLGSLDFNQEKNSSSINVDYSAAPIWWCWFQGVENLPLIPKLCLQSLRKHANGHPINIITKENLSEYVSLAPNIYKKLDKGIITYAHFSDILRMALVQKFGGLWIDSTVYVTEDLPEQIFQSSLFTIKTKPSGFFVSRCRWTGFCFSGKKDSPLAKGCSELFANYWEKNNVLIDYFMIDQTIDILYKNSNVVCSMIDQVPFNNPNVHQLNKLLTADYSESHFKSLVSETYLFKLNWRTYSSEQLLSNPNNYYQHLLTLANS